jgi:hypothetical protein
MTREVMDVIPQGSNIQAIGIMIPGTALQVGGGGALSREVGGSGCLSAVAVVLSRLGRVGPDRRRHATQ